MYPEDLQVERLQGILDLYKAAHPDVVKCSVYHIGPIFWLKYRQDEVLSSDARLGNFDQAFSAITKLTGSLRSQAIYFTPSSTSHVDPVNKNIQKLMVEATTPNE